METCNEKSITFPFTRYCWYTLELVQPLDLLTWIQLQFVSAVTGNIQIQWTFQATNESLSAMTLSSSNTHMCSYKLLLISSTSSSRWEQHLIKNDACVSTYMLDEWVKSKQTALIDKSICSDTAWPSGRKRDLYDDTFKETFIPRKALCHHISLSLCSLIAFVPVSFAKKWNKLCSRCLLKYHAAIFTPTPWTCFCQSYLSGPNSSSGSWVSPLSVG